jgi:hypothetical protein
MPVDLLGLRNEAVDFINNEGTLVDRTISMDEFEIIKKYVNSEYCSHLYEFTRESARHFGAKDPERTAELSVLTIFGTTYADDNQVDNKPRNERIDELNKISNFVKGKSPAITLGERVVSYVMSKLAPEDLEKFVYNSISLLNEEKKSINCKNPFFLIDYKKNIGANVIKYVGILSGEKSIAFRHYLSNIGAALQLYDEIEDAVEDEKNDTPSLINDGYSKQTLEELALERLNAAKESIFVETKEIIEETPTDLKYEDLNFIEKIKHIYAIATSRFKKPKHDTAEFTQISLNKKEVTLEKKVRDNLELNSIIDDLFRHRTRDNTHNY